MCLKKQLVQANNTLTTNMLKQKTQIKLKQKHRLKNLISSHKCVAK